jgi:hypothetical protein
MKVLICGLVIIAALAACGGGGGGGLTPQPLPSATPPSPTFSSKIVFLGSLAGHTIQSDLRRMESVAMDASATPVPIMVVSAPDANADVAVYGGAVQAVVSPEPAFTPSVSFSQNNPNAVVVTPQPSASPQALPTGVIAQVFVNGTNTVQAQSAGTASAIIGAPVNQTPTTPVYSYMSVALDCHNPGDIAGGTSLGYAAHFGWKWTGSTWAPDDNVSDADIYVDGPSCVASNPSETVATIHIVGGDTRISTDTPFNAVSASLWANVETSFTTTTALMTNADGSVNALVIGKTRDGSHTFKLFPNEVGSNDGFFGAVEVSGSSIDGF